MLETITIGQSYRSQSGYLFKVLDLPKHAQDCSVGMVYYEALEPTFDSPKGSTWVIEQSLFLKRFNLVEGL